MMIMVGWSELAIVAATFGAVGVLIGVTFLIAWIANR